MLKTALKIIFAIGIIVYLIVSGKLDFTLLYQAIDKDTWWWAALLLLITQAACSSIRWKWLLETGATKEILLFPLVKLTWIGLFFNSVLPGAVTGDLIKLVYARDLDPNLSRTFLVMSALLDRVIGLIGLIILTGFFTFFNHQALRELSPKMEGVIHFNIVLFTLALLALITLFLPPRIQKVILSLVVKVPYLGERIAKTCSEIWVIGGSKIAVLKSLILSLLLQFNSVFCFWLLTMPFYDRPLPLSLAFSFIPIGLISVALPVSPGGLGVGHVIFDTLFRYAGVSGGASLFNIFFFALLFVNLLGFFPYIFSSKKHALKDAEKFEKT